MTPSRTAIGVLGALLALGACTRTEPVDLEGMTPARHEAVFPVATGTHGGTACDRCHLDPSTFSAPSCIGCHEHNQQLTDAAHLGVVEGYQFAGTACYACHPRGEAEGFNHEAQFPIAVGTTHQEARCGSCHPDATARKRLDCVGCHTREKADPRHTAVDGYLWASASCFGCHPRADIPLPVDHQLRFPIGPGSKHQGIGCVTCHVDPANRKTLDCVSCHTHEKTLTDANHAQVTGYEYTSASCYRCHPQANVESVVDHTPFFPTAAGSKHQGIACATCHPVPGDRKQFDCLSCHTHEKTRTDANHGGVAGYQYQSPSCYGCHPDATVGEVAHPYFPVDPGTTHQDAACSSCHQVPGDRKVVNCGSCHSSAETAPQHTQVGGYSFSSPLCIRCHGDGQLDRVALHLPFRITGGAKHAGEPCLTCHPGFRTDKPWAADFTLPKLSCGPCHSRGDMDDKHRNFSGYQYSPPSCFTSGCHPDGSKP
ncbi:MAG: hypothetical protein M3Y59_03570 [Myxococcota bacterium]|nr:hypothetical protein [Myxococcota bacterium]